MEVDYLFILDDTAKTDVKYGCKPTERSLETLLDAGVILVDKPRGPSSHQLTAWAREMLGIQRLGHGGTLDPFATGLLTFFQLFCMVQDNQIRDIIHPRAKIKRQKQEKHSKNVFHVHADN